MPFLSLCYCEARVSNALRKNLGRSSGKFNQSLSCFIHGFCSKLKRIKITFCHVVSNKKSSHLFESSLKAFLYRVTSHESALSSLPAHEFWLHFDWGGKCKSHQKNKREMLCCKLFQQFYSILRDVGLEGKTFSSLIAETWAQLFTWYLKRALDAFSTKWFLDNRGKVFYTRISASWI